MHRVILLSDGKANVGPDSPSELRDLGASLRKENISVSTMGLGLNYHEDLMTQLALKSNGNHLFIENADELMAVFQSEFDDVLSVVAQEIAIHIKLHAGFRPVRVLGQEAEIQGQHVTVMLNQLYAEQEKFILLEVEVPATKEKESRAVADVEVSYANLQTKTTDRLTSAIAVRCSADQVFCDASRNNDVLEKSVLLIANDQNQLATRLRDQGKLNEAQLLLISNGRFLETNAIKLKSDLLKLWCAENLEQAQYLDDENWNKTRSAWSPMKAIELVRIYR